MRWIPIQVAVCNISKNVPLSIRIFLQVTVEIIKVETQLWSSVLVKKTQPIDMIWKLSFSLKVFFFKRKLSYKRPLLE